MLKNQTHILYAEHHHTTDHIPTGLSTNTTGVNVAPLCILWCFFFVFANVSVVCFWGLFHRWIVVHVHEVSGSMGQRSHFGYYI